MEHALTLIEKLAEEKARNFAIDEYTEDPYLFVTRLPVNEIVQAVGDFGQHQLHTILHNGCAWGWEQSKRLREKAIENRVKELKTKFITKIVEDAIVNAAKEDQCNNQPLPSP